MQQGRESIAEKIKILLMRNVVCRFWLAFLLIEKKVEVEVEVDGCQAKAHFANRINKAYQAHHKDGDPGAN